MRQFLDHSNLLKKKWSVEEYRKKSNLIDLSDHTSPIWTNRRPADRMDTKTQSVCSWRYNDDASLPCQCWRPNCRNGWIEALRPPSTSKLTEFIVQVINQEINTKWFSNRLLVFFLRPVVFGSNSNPTAINVNELFEYREKNRLSSAQLQTSAWGEIFSFKVLK